MPEEELSQVLEQSLEWDDVLETARTHGVTSLVSGALCEHCSDAVPEEALERFRTRSKFVARRNLQMLREAVELSTAFEKRGIRAIPYRGPMVAKLAYGNVTFREFGDLDFLLPHGDLPAARTILVERGYEPRYLLESTEELTETQEWAYTQFARDYPFEHATEPFEVELHWRVVSQHFPTQIDLETVWDRRSAVSIAGTEVPVLSPEDRLFMLCVHGTRHRWERLEWSCDVAEFLRRHEVDWNALGRRASKHHCERMVYLGLDVARELHDVTLPETVRESIEADPKIAELTAHVCERLFDGTDYWSLDEKQYQARTLERYRDKGKFWMYWLCKPDRPDIETAPFPKPLVPLYAVVRWLRLASAASKRALSGRRKEGNRKNERVT